jgi:hypothetical protein
MHANHESNHIMKAHWKKCLLFAPVLSLVLLLGACGGAPRTQPISDRGATAEAMFAERCKKAAEKIYKTVENVEGIYLMKIRPEAINLKDQFKLDDPYGSDIGGDRYIANFLRGFYPPIFPVASGVPPRAGYRYVEAVDAKDGLRYRYTGGIKEVTHTSSVLVGGDGKTTFKTKDFVVDRVPALGPAPRYAVTFDDLSTREERDYWIAGSSLRVIDLQAREVIAERVGYMMDSAQGSQAGGRSPWLLAANHACPGFERSPLWPVPPGRGSTAQISQTIDFVEKILKPHPLAK